MKKFCHVQHVIRAYFMHKVQTLIEVSGFCFVLPRSEKKRQSIMANFDFHLNPPSPTLKKYSMSQKVMLGKIG